MAIRSVRIYYHPRLARREKWLAANYWGWAEWFENRLKPRREDLRGPEAKGVDIVNLVLREEPANALNRDCWIRALNTFQFEFVCDLSPLGRGDKISNLEMLMRFYAVMAKSAPWPQMQHVAAALAEPLSVGDRLSLEPYLHWPRRVGQIARYLS